MLFRRQNIPLPGILVVIAMALAEDPDIVQRVLRTFVSVS
jgi:hypothetical protein